MDDWMTALKQQKWLLFETLMLSVYKCYIKIIWVLNLMNTTPSQSRSVWCQILHLADRDWSGTWFCRSQFYFNFHGLLDNKVIFISDHIIVNNVIFIYHRALVNNVIFISDHAIVNNVIWYLYIIVPSLTMRYLYLIVLSLTMWYLYITVLSLTMWYLYLIMLSFLTVMILAVL